MILHLAFAAGAAGMDLTAHQAGHWAPFNTEPFTRVHTAPPLQL